MNKSLEHHGIKGMKLGVRRTPEQLGHRETSRVSNGLSDSSIVALSEFREHTSFTS